MNHLLRIPYFCLYALFLLGCGSSFFVTAATDTVTPSATTPVGSYEVCYVCGDPSNVMRKSDAEVQVLDFGLMTCGELERFGLDGNIPTSSCDVVPFIIVPCECESSEKEPTVAPTTTLPPNAFSQPPILLLTGQPIFPSSSYPSRFPTERSSARPTVVSESPSIAPRDSMAPTGAPSTVPPSENPTTDPTTRSPSPQPTTGPTSLPTSIPTTNPSTPVPTTSRTPSIGPSNPPSIPPTDFELIEQEHTVFNVQMMLGNTDAMPPISVENWKIVTANQIAQEVMTVNRNRLKSLRVIVSFDSQTPEYQPTPSPTAISEKEEATASVARANGFWGPRRKLDARVGDRALQFAGALEISFDVDIVLRSEVTDHDAMSYISTAFNSVTDRDNFIESLEARDSHFSQTDSVSVLMETTASSSGPSTVNMRNFLIITVLQLVCLYYC